MGPSEWLPVPLRPTTTNEDLHKPTVAFDPPEGDVQPGEEVEPFPRDDPKRQTPHPGDLAAWKKKRAEEAQEKQAQLENSDHEITEHAPLLASELETVVTENVAAVNVEDQKEITNEEDQMPLLVNDEVDSNEEQNRPDRSSVKFLPGSPTEPTESRLK